MINRLLLAFTLCCSLFLAACASKTSDTVGALPQTHYDTVEKTLTQANKKKGEQAISLYLAAIDLAWQQGDTLKARTLLDVLDLSAATPAQQMFAGTLAAELANARGQSHRALEILNSPDFERLTELPIAQQARSQLARAIALEAVGRPLAAARERIYTAPYLTAEAAVNNHEYIWRLINELPSSHYQVQNEPDLDGWLNLAKLTKSTQSLEQKQSDIRNWIQQNPAHPAAIRLPAELQALQQLQVKPVERIAILLPSQDTNQNVVNAIRNGLLGAYYYAQANQQKTPQLRFYDSSELTSLAALYRGLEQNKIDVLIGPWEKNLIRILSEQPQLPLTTLALNYADNQTSMPAELFQFGLAAEDEARMAAERAWADGMRNAAILVQSGEWGTRIQNAFAQHWEKLGGNVVGARNIAEPIELAQQIADLFQLRESEARSKRLQNLLGMKVYSQPSRRRDIDFIFLAASPQQARQIKPTLRFQYAGDVPIYATSAVNPGNSGDGTQNDLEGILLTEIPWMLDEQNSLRNQIISQWPEAGTLMGRFYAMGADAYQLASQLQQLKALPNNQTDGFTGSLQLNPLQRIERTLHWAQIKEGKLRPVLHDDFSK